MVKLFSVGNEFLLVWYKKSNPQLKMIICVKIKTNDLKYY